MQASRGLQFLRQRAFHTSRIVAGGVYDDLLSRKPLPKPGRRASVIGVPFNFGQPITGVDEGPALIRQAGLIARLKSIGWVVNDRGDFQLQPKSDQHPSLESSKGRAKYSYAIGMNMRALSEDVAKTVAEKDNEFTLVLGGDHTIASGSLSGIASVRPDVGVVWVDAHADINTPTSTPSGNMHGMPLGLLCRGLVKHSELPGFDWMADKHMINQNQIVYIGLRDVDPGEVEMIRELGILTFTMHDIDRLGIGRVMDLVTEHLKGRPLHLSYDIDALDPTICPATGTKVLGGLTFREGNFVAEALSLTGQLKSMDLVEVNPKLSDAQGVSSTVNIAVDIIMSAMGKNIL